MPRTSAAFEGLVGKMVTIPTVPHTLLEINRIINDPEGTAREAANVVNKDPALATKTLRLANSSLYSLQVPVSDIRHAVSILGLRILRNLVVQATVLQQFKGSSKNRRIFDPIWLWDHSVKVACAARLLVQRSEHNFGMDHEEAYTAGLLHDVGMILLLDSMQDRFLAMTKRSTADRVPLHLIEKEELGFTHADAAALLVERWNLSPVLREAIEHHHARDFEDKDMQTGLLISLANAIAHSVTERTGPYFSDEDLDAAALERMGISELDLAEIQAEVKAARLET
ncbi:MAG: HDOD domain-containing protein [Planctomycetota bacterium]